MNISFSYVLNAKQKYIKILSIQKNILSNFLNYKRPLISRKNSFLKFCDSKDRLNSILLCGILCFLCDTLCYNNLTIT